jgi:hypothetical protein
MRSLCIILLFVSSGFLADQEVKDVYKVVDIENDDHIYFIRNDNGTGMVVSDNDSLKVDASFTKIEVNKKYFFVLNERKFRGKASSGYMILDSSGKNHKIWDVERDGEMPKIYTAKNIKGSYIQDNAK